MKIIIVPNVESNSFQRQIRQMVASSIHEIASILGPELATADLIPIYNSLINDVEDIRIAALNHLSCFVRVSKLIF